VKVKTHKWIAIAIFSCVALVLLLSAIGFVTSEGDVLPIKRLAVVRIEGVITDATWHANVLREHLNNRNVAGVLLRIDSPGGAVAPSQELYNEVAAYKEIGKPLVVSMGNVAASGGYYIAAPAQKIFASPGTITGSIGVIFTLPMYQELAKKIGIDMRVLKAGEMKDMGSPYRPMSEAETAFMQTLLDDVHEQFITDVAKGRETEEEEIRAWADGRILTGKQAYESQLVDTLGGFAEAFRHLSELCGVSEFVRPVEKKQKTGWREYILESKLKELPGAETITRPAGLYYLYIP
jgi:protease-4